MVKKKIFLLLGIVLFSVFFINNVYAQTYPSCYQDVATFNDSTSSKNITFTGNQNQTVWIRLPQTPNYMNAQLNLSGIKSMTREKHDMIDGLDWFYLRYLETNGTHFIGGPSPSFKLYGMQNNTVNTSNNQTYFRGKELYNGINAGQIVIFGIASNDTGPIINIWSIAQNQSTSPWSTFIYYYVYNGSLYVNYQYRINITSYVGNIVNGLAVNDKGTEFWVAQYSSNKIYHIDINGNSLDNITSMVKPMGLDTVNNSLFISDAQDFNISEYNLSTSQYILRHPTSLSTDIYDIAVTGSYIYDAGWDEGTEYSFDEYNSNYPTNPYLDVSNDGDAQWSHTGTFTETNNRVSNFATEINNYLYNCTPTIGSFCDIPLVFHSDTVGMFQADDINMSCTNPLHSTILYNPISSIGYYINSTVNISVTDVDTYQFCNISVNNQTYTNVTFANNQTSYQFNWTDGLNTFTVNCTDQSGLYNSNINTTTVYIKKIVLIEEDTGNIFSNFTQLNVLRAIDEGNQTIFNFLTLNSTWVYAANSNPDAVIRIEKKYTDTLFIDLAIRLLFNETKVCVANTQQFYEIILYSKQIRPIALKNYLGNCYVLIGDTRYAYQDAQMAKAYTIRAGYGLYTVETNGTFTFLSSVDGGLAAAHDIDVIEFNKNQPSFSLISDQFGYESTNTTLLVYYVNQKNDNLQTDVILKNGTLIWGIWNETIQPNNFTVAFSTAGFPSGLLTLDIIKHKGSGVIETIEQTISYGVRVILNSSLAIILSVSLTFFGLTFVATKYAFGWFGIIVMIISLAITTLAPATASLRLIQAVDIIMLAYIVLIYREENIRVT